MEPLQITLTTAGLAVIATDGSAGFGPAQIAEVGLTNIAFTAAATLTAIPGEFKRLAVNGEDSGNDQLHIVALDDAADTYSYRGFGIYLDDGTLFAVYSQPDPIAGKAEVSASYLAIDIQLEAGQTANITFGDTNWINPPASTTRQGVVELATNAEAKAGADATRAITPSSAKAAILDWLGFTPLDAAAFTPAAILSRLLGVDGSGSALDSDLLDGHDTSYFQTAASSSTGSNANGQWEKRPNDVIEQWGEALAGETNSPASLDFPIAFTDLASINLQVTSQNPSITDTSGDRVGGKKTSVTQFNVYSNDGGQTVSWRAIGR